MSSPTLTCPRWRRVAACGVLSLMLAVASARAVDPAPSYPWQDELWRQAADLRVDDALSLLPERRKAGSDAERRAIDFTRAVLLLNVQPRLRSHISQARKLLESVRQTSVDDATGLAALYDLARIAQFHADPADPVKAAALYSELIARAPDFPLAQEAVSRVAALRLYENLSPDELRSRLAEYEAIAQRLTAAPARRDLHLVLATALLDLTTDQEGILRHLLAAEEAGIQRQQLRAETLVRIAVLARSLGRRDVAIAHYKTFLAEFTRDTRTSLLEEQLKALEAESPPSP